MSDLVFLRPWWHLALPALAVLAVVVWRRGPDAGGWQAVIAPQMLHGLRALGHLSISAQSWQRYLPLIAAAVLIVALSGPAFPRPDAPVFAQTNAIVIAIDMSPSVTQSAALADAQAATAQILEHTAGRPVGLIVFAGEAYEVAAPTDDPATLESQIAVLDRETMPDRGSRPAAALSLAAQVLTGLKHADLILLSDGGGIDEAARAEADRLRAAGVRISALILSGTAPEAPVPDEAALRDLVNGAIAPARSPAPVLSGLVSAAGLSRDPALSALRFHDMGLWLAALALVPLLPLFRRRS